MEPDRFQQGIKATLSRVHCQRSQFLLPCRNAHSAGSCLTFQYPAPDSVAICAAEAGHHFPDSIVPRRCTGAVGYHTPFVEHCWPAFDYYSVGGGARWCDSEWVPGGGDCDCLWRWEHLQFCSQLFCCLDHLIYWLHSHPFDCKGKAMMLQACVGIPYAGRWNFIASMARNRFIYNIIA
jgi:hypothetical protein